MLGSFSEELLRQFKDAYAERQAMAIGYPQQSYSNEKPKKQAPNR
jgi:hypothetical protein